MTTQEFQERQSRDWAQAKRIYYAMRLRPLTDEEMAVVERLGYGIVNEPEMYRDEDIRRAFNEAALQQAQIRALYQKDPA